MRQISWRALGCAAWLAACLGGCADSGQGPPPGGGPSDTGPLIELDSAGGQDLDGAQDQGQPDLPPAQDMAELERGDAGTGEPCRSNLDCAQGFCISSSRGFLCTQACSQDEDCPELGGAPTSCQLSENFGADGLRLCVPEATSLCQPCFTDANCFNGACVNFGDQRMACGRDCAEGDPPCPEGTVCRFNAPGGGPLEVPQCLPQTLSCSCSEATAGSTRPCVRLDQESGARCFGVETCDPQRGWQGCDAPAPAPEICDGQDNDCNGAVDDGLVVSQACELSNEAGACAGVETCQGERGWVCQAPEPAAERCDLLDNNCDGQVDEDFRDEQGLYVDPQHCGACNNDCQRRFPLAEQTRCVVDQGQARCTILSCQPGFVLSGDTACLPLRSRLCEPCTADEQCNASAGDRCLTYENGERFCGRDCSPGSPFGQSCPEGYTCDPDSSQCVRDGGDCLCGPGEDFLLTCTLEPVDPQGQRCVGEQRCQDGALSACQPPAEVCDGFDDDCDGIVDNGFRDEATGAYLSDNHCGRCFHDCVALFSEPSLHGAGRCTGRQAVEMGQQPTCALDCDPGWSDVNGVVSDGCECELLTPGADEPDLNGQDSDCDGIDGQVSRGWFVSPTGDDQAQGTREAPLRSIQAAIDRAGGARSHVYVAAGVYHESLTLRPGVSVFGGYSADYARRSPRGNETALFGQAPTEAQPATVNGANIQGAATVVSGLTIIGHDNNSPSGNSYAVFLSDCDAAVTLRHNIIRGGMGGSGGRGEPGSAGNGAPDNATEGQPQRGASALYCQDSPINVSPGGQGATHSCQDALGAQVSTQGGAGGAADCPRYNQPEGHGANGGGPFPGVGGISGYNQYLDWDNGGECTVCIIPDAFGVSEVGGNGGNGGNGSFGPGGQGCGAGPGQLVNGQWRPGRSRLNPNDPSQPDYGHGGDGLRGAPGGGGGGGGAGSGVQRLNQYPRSCALAEVLGGGGGGGGAGGCGGSGGTGGTPGGGSLAVVVTFHQPPATLPTLQNNQIERGYGGLGGDGGPGAEGGDGSPGKEALALAPNQQVGALPCADPGGRGGDGGDGGPGGGGGGGCGGISAGVFVWGHNGLDTSVYRSNNSYPSTGAPGEGGVGGGSLGLGGGDGGDGLYQEVVQ